MASTVQGTQVQTIKLSGKDYVTVAERSRAAHETTDHEPGYSMVDENFFEMNGRYFVTVTIFVGGKHFKGTSEIKFNATSGADKTNPIECAETSAVGRALGFAGFGALDSIASADEVERAMREQGQTPQTTPARPQEVTAAPTPARATRPSTSPPMTNVGATDPQLRAIGNLCAELGKEPPLNPLTTQEAAKMISDLNAERERRKVAS